MRNAVDRLREFVDTPLFSEFRERLLSVNKKINLTRIISEDEFRIKHIEDSLMPLFSSKYFNFDFYGVARRTIDIGTGGGFPVFPMALLFNGGVLLEQAGLNHTFLGSDSVGKKMKALTLVAEEIGVPRLDFVTGRAEDLARLAQYRESFDAVTSRAVAELSVLLEYMAPFAAVGGLVAAYKSGNIADELELSRSAADKLSLELVEQLAYSLSGNMGERTLLVYKKYAATKGEYPRKAGIPKKAPL